MYNWNTAAELSAKFWEAQPTDNTATINGFAGTFNITDHHLIPSSLVDYLTECFHGYTRLSRVPLEDLNDALNEVWEGPGSMPKVIRATYKLRETRRANLDDTKDPLKGYDTPTVDSQLVSNDDVSS